VDYFKYSGNSESEDRVTAEPKENKSLKGEIEMPEFGSPFSGLAKDRKLTDEELIRAIRFMVSEEYEATQLYMQLAESTDNKLAVDVLKDIADEERVHVGEFLRLLHKLAPDEEKFYDKGTKEVEKIIKTNKKLKNQNS
jgi:rubrerythrin